MSYPPQQLVKEAMSDYFKENDLGEDGGLNKMWAKIKVGPIYLPLLNIPARRKALIFHDIHHIVTGYSGKWEGEVSISAWEISSGCGKLWAAWLIDSWAIAIGIFIYPESVFKAFLRGRRTKNLYSGNIPYQEALAMQISDLQNKLLLTQYVEQKPTRKEKQQFAFYVVISLLWFFIPFIIIPAILFYYLLK